MCCFNIRQRNNTPYITKKTPFHVYILHEGMSKYYVSNTVQRHQIYTHKQQGLSNNFSIVVFFAI